MKGGPWRAKKNGGIGGGIHINDALPINPAPDNLALLLLIFSTLEAEGSAQFRIDNLTWLAEFSKSLEAKANHPLYQLIARVLHSI